LYNWYKYNGLINRSYLDAYINDKNIITYDNTVILDTNYIAYLPILNEDIKKIENKEYNQTSNIISDNIECDNIKSTLNNLNIKLNNIYIKSKNTSYEDINNNINCWWCTI
jgi:hypothetical protein